MTQVCTDRLAELLAGLTDIVTVYELSLTWQWCVDKLCSFFHKRLKHISVRNTTIVLIYPDVLACLTTVSPLENVFIVKLGKSPDAFSEFKIMGGCWPFSVQVRQTTTQN